MLPSPSIIDTLLGAIDIMQEAIAQRGFASEPPDVRPQTRYEQLSDRSSITAPRWRSPKGVTQSRRCSPPFALHWLPRIFSFPLGSARLSRPNIGSRLLPSTR